MERGKEEKVEPYKFQQPYPLDKVPPKATEEEWLIMRMIVSGQLFGDKKVPRS